MSKELVNLANIVPFPKSCGFCESKENVQLFAGLMLCGSCQENIRTTNPGMFTANNQIEKKSLGLIWAPHKTYYVNFR